MWFRPAVFSVGALDSDDATAAGELPPNVKSIKWAYSTRSIYGWGDSGTGQKATAGWLAALPVFEPHWQVNNLFLHVVILRHLAHVPPRLNSV